MLFPVSAGALALMSLIFGRSARPHAPTLVFPSRRSRRRQFLRCAGGVLAGRRYRLPVGPIRFPLGPGEHSQSASQGRESGALLRSSASRCFYFDVPSPAAAFTQSSLRRGGGASLALSTCRQCRRLRGRAPLVSSFTFRLPRIGGSARLGLLELLGQVAAAVGV